ncbi:MAG: heparinase II/III-family protein [Armatimonadota bacterium]|nr:heparinase II/III-family protein [Armatimonadota bacterium]
MNLFLTDSERARLESLPVDSPAAALLSAMHSRVSLRAAAPGLSDRGATTDWWHHAAEYLTDAALVQAVRPSPEVAAWLRSSVLSIVRRPPSDWAGPPFRGGGGGGGDMVGSLETGHLTWGVAVALDLAPDLFPTSEREEIVEVLRVRGIAPCRRFLDRSGFCHNWNCVLLAGLAVAAAVLDDREALAAAAAWFPLAADHFQPDGSYGESLQYANYAAYSLMLAHEALLRRGPAGPAAADPAAAPTFEPYARLVHWAAHALFYRKPLSGWGASARPRSANFGDSGAIFRPSGDLLTHIAVRAREALPVEAGLARWLFDTLYFPADEPGLHGPGADDPGPHDRVSFGFVNGFGFLSAIMLPAAAAPLSPTEAGLPATVAFSAGDAFARDAWGGLTTLAARVASEPRHASAHLHGDINSFILVHRQERLLLDPGHSCYRNLHHDLENASLTHNTCTFELPPSATAPARILTQRGGINRLIVRDAGPLRGEAPADTGGRRLITARSGPVSVIGSEAAPLYGAPLRVFSRLWMLCGAHALFIVDRIESDEPVRATWHFLLNNRDNLLDLRLANPDAGPDRLVARRGGAALKLVHFGSGQRSGPIFGYVHDAYHPRPAQLGEGRPGSGHLMRWTETTPAAARTVVHALCFDSAAAILDWDARSEGDDIRIASPGRGERWTLRADAEGASFHLAEATSGTTYTVARDPAGAWSLMTNS